MWTEFYEDAFGLGLINTVSLPVFSQTNNTGYFLGIAGIDVLKNYWVEDLNASSSNNNILRELDTQKSYQIKVPKVTTN